MCALDKYTNTVTGTAIGYNYHVIVIIIQYFRQKLLLIIYFRMRLNSSFWWSL